MKRFWAQFCCTLLFVVTDIPLFSRAQPIQSSEKEFPAPAQVLSSKELAGLRPIVEHDLKGPLKRAYNEDDLNQAELDDQFNRCRITRLKLGKLGEALLVEGVDVHSRNEPMINVYLPRRNSYRLVLAGSGFGPEVVPNRSGIPYLIFGGTSGPGSEVLIRYHYDQSKTTYVADGCNTRATTDHSCRGKKLPKFAYQWPE
jgi:hypothetical protein